MAKQHRTHVAFICAGVLLMSLAMLNTAAMAQLSERASDPTGFSLRVPRVQVIHSDRADLPGTSMSLQRHDPWLAYELGHSYFEREWTPRDGLFNSITVRPFAGAANSCAMCHNLPFRSAGFSGNIAEPAGFGFSAPHLFGIGLLETIALQVRQEILADFDTNHNGYLDVPVETKGRRAIVNAAPGVKIDFGSLEDLNGDGYPGLNNVIKVTFVDTAGKVAPPRPDGAPARLGDPGVKGYDLAVAFLSATTTDHQLPSLRVFALGVMQTVMGLSIKDRTVSNDSGTGRDQRAFDGWAETSNAGMPQPYFPVADKDCGRGCLPISEGELDLIEWYLMNNPAPGTAAQNSQTRQGRRLLDQFGCTGCHVADWSIRAADEKAGYPGDRRFFDLEVAAAPASGRLQGKLRILVNTEQRGDSTTYAPRRSGYEVKNVFTDLRHHDLGERFYAYSYSGTGLVANKMFRTTPLWGVGSTAPYGHDGRSATLDAVIRRHGGEAAPATTKYVSAHAGQRAALIAFLESLVLYQPDELPSDINGDGRIDQIFTRAGREVGPERFWPELMFQVAPLYRGWVNEPDGGRYFSWELLNASEAYGQNLAALIDADGDRVPDIENRGESKNGNGASHTPRP